MDEKKVATIQALLNKAQSTTFPEEAAALSAKAQELMVRYGIEEAMLADVNRAKVEQIISKKIMVPGPYLVAKIQLFSAVARGNGCQVMQQTGFRKFVYGYFVGFESDVERAEMMFNSLLLQAAALMPPKPAHINGTSFRNSYYFGFAHEMGRRLREARAATIKDVKEEQGAGVSLVLVDRDRQVLQELNRLAGGKASGPQLNINGAGYGSGVQAGQKAGMGGGVGVNTGIAGSLGRGK